MLRVAGIGADPQQHLPVEAGVLAHQQRNPSGSAHAHAHRNRAGRRGDLSAGRHIIHCNWARELLR